MPRTVLRTFLTGLTAAGALLIASGVASAHVTVSPSSVPAGQDTVLTFRVPDEKDDASTVGLRLVLADGAALHEVSVLAKPGWEFSMSAPTGTASSSPQPTVPQATATAAPPATPMPNMPGMANMPGMSGGMSGMSRPGLKRVDSTPSPSASTASGSDSDDGGPAVGSINWTAKDSAAAIAPGTFAEFSIAAAMPADRSSLVFAAIQTYSDGSVVRWIDRAAPGSAEPAHPAPTVTLGTGDSTPSTTMAAPPPAAPKTGQMSMSMSGMSGMDMSGSRSDSVNVALFVAICALIAGMTAAVLAMNAYNRTRRAPGVSGGH